MRIGIITINDYNNFGNRLQNYAVQEVLNSFDINVETLIIQPKSVPDNVMLKIQRNMRLSPKLIMIKIPKFLKGRFTNHSAEKLIGNRLSKFKKFTLTYIDENDIIIDEGNIPCDLSRQYDYFIIGSDQIWNPVFRLGSALDFATFAPAHKRIAYAASFGISDIPERYQSQYSKWLTEMAHVSVREEPGAKIVKELTGREVPVLVDPTLMLSKEKWLSVSKKAKNKPSKEYLLTYFLGDVSKRNRRVINNIAKRKGLDIVQLASLKDKDRYDADPGEFIDYIDSASIFMTDSFHGVIFSILLEKPFIVFDRVGNIPSMSSRIDTLLSKFKLQERKWENMKLSNDIFYLDYSHVPHILEAERQMALDYLRKALDIKDIN